MDQITYLEVLLAQRSIPMDIVAAQYVVADPNTGELVAIMEA